MSASSTFFQHLPRVDVADGIYSEPGWLRKPTPVTFLLFYWWLHSVTVAFLGTTESLSHCHPCPVLGVHPTASLIL